jgi:hypothetical protein
MLAKPTGMFLETKLFWVCIKPPNKKLIGLVNKELPFPLEEHALGQGFISLFLIV